MSDIEHLAASIKQSLRPELQDQALILAQKIIDASKSSIQESAEYRNKAQTQIGVDSELLQALQELAGKKVETSSASVSFGSGSQTGDITIRDTAGRDIFNITIVSPSLDKSPLGSKFKPLSSAIPYIVFAVVLFVFVYILYTNANGNLRNNALEASDTEFTIIENSLTSSSRLTGELRGYQIAFKSCYYAALAGWVCEFSMVNTTPISRELNLRWSRLTDTNNSQHFSERNFAKVIIRFEESIFEDEAVTAPPGIQTQWAVVFNSMLSIPTTTIPKIELNFGEDGEIVITNIEIQEEPENPF